MSSRPVALVTGATRGVGRATAVALARDGLDIVISGRSTRGRPDKRLPGTLEETQAELEELGATVEAVAADLADSAGIETVVSATNQRFGGCDLLVNNAAISYNAPFLEVDIGRLRKAIALDLVAPMALAHALVPGMAERGGGQVINVSSRAAVQGGPSLSYSVAKSGIERFTRGFAEQLTSSGVTCTCVRIDELVITEAVELTVPGARDQGGVSVDAMGDAIAWMAAHQSDVHGKIVTMSELHALGALPEL